MNILIIDISDQVAGKIGRKLEGLGHNVWRTCSLIDLTRQIGVGSGNKWIAFEPNLILNFHSQDTQMVTDLLHIAHNGGVVVRNPPGALETLSNRVLLQQRMRFLGLKMPQFYYGHPSLIPGELGQRVILKSLKGHLVMKVDRKEISSREELVYCEEVISNAPALIRSVYFIGGETFTILKGDALRGERRRKERVENDGYEVHIVEKIATDLGLHYFNVDFIRGIIIDVNAFPNFFPYPFAVKALVESV